MIHHIFRSISRNIRRYLKRRRRDSSNRSLIIKKTHSHPLEKKNTNMNHQLVLSGSSWHDIPDDIMETIVHKLSIGDRVRMGAVCKSWRAILARVRIVAREAPWLMLPYKPWCESMSFYSLSEGRIYNFEMPKLSPLGHGGWCFGSSRGWLVMVAGLDYDLDMFLLKPISGARIKLPPLKPITSFLNFMQTLASDDNVSSFIQRVEIFSASSSDDDMVVAAVFGVEFDQVLAFCRPQDLQWTIFGDGGNLHYEDILFHKDILYALVSTEEEIGEVMVTGETHTIGLTSCNVQLGLINYICGDQSLENNDDDDHESFSGVEIYPEFTNFAGIVEDDHPLLVESTSGKSLLVLRIIDMFSADTDVNDDEEGKQDEEFDIEYD